MLCAKNAFNDKPLTYNANYASSYRFCGFFFSFFFFLSCWIFYARKYITIKEKRRERTRDEESKMLPTLEIFASAPIFPCCNWILRAWINHKAADYIALSEWAQMIAKKEKRIPLSQWNASDNRFICSSFFSLFRRVQCLSCLSVHCACHSLCVCMWKWNL